MKHFMELSVSHPCIGTTLGPKMIEVLTIEQRMSAS
jgi:hypothetical protein